MARETPEQKARREQMELMARLNAERDARLTTRQQNDLLMRGAPRPYVEQTPQGSGPAALLLGGLAGRAQNALQARARNIDSAVNRASGKPPR